MASLLARALPTAARLAAPTSLAPLLACAPCLRPLHTLQEPDPKVLRAR